MPSSFAMVNQSVLLAMVNTHAAPVLCSIGPAIPGELVYPQELTEMTGPLLVLLFMGWIHGPPEEPPDRPQFGNHQLTEPSVVISSAQYIKLGSSL